MSQGARPLAITGYGVVCATGRGVAALREHVVAGRSALALRSRIPATLVDAGWTGSVPERLDLRLDALPGVEVQRLFVAWAIAAGREALVHARVAERHASARVALVIGSNLEDYPEPLWALLDEVAATLAIAGPRLLVSMACASSLAALSLARGLLERGDADAVLVGGSDVLTPRVAGGFRSLDLLAPEPCAPFSATLGTALGEGAGVLVVEREAPPELAVHHWLLGEGSAADAYHETSPEPRGRGSELALTRALQQAGLAPAQLDLVMAHGTGTLANDAAEARALRRVLGPELARVRVGAGKSLVGHAQGAAGAIELIASLLGIEAGVLPELTHFVGPARAEAPPRLLIDDASRREVVERLAIEGAGFGGAHAAAIVGRPIATPQPEPTRRPTLRGWAALRPSADGRVELDPRRAVRGVDLRGCDPSTRLLTAIVDAGLNHARTPRSDRRAHGLFVAQRGSSTAAITRLRGEIDRFGMAGASASAFVDSLAIMPAGACTRVLELWGPMQLVCGDALAGLVALIGACEAFMADPRLVGVVAAGVAEYDGERPGDTREGAGALVVGEGGPLELRGWAIVGPDHDPLAPALARAELDRVDTLVRLAALDELAWTLPGAGEPLPTSIAWLAEGRGGRAAVVAGPPR